jgi:hypothetical protein
MGSLSAGVLAMELESAIFLPPSEMIIALGETVAFSYMNSR